MAFRNLTLQASTALGASFNGTAIPVDRNKCFAIAAVVDSASSLDGVLKIQGSLLAGADAPGSSDTSWGDLTGLTFTITANGCYIFQISDHALKWVRLVWTRTGGTGNVTQTFNENE